MGKRFIMENTIDMHEFGGTDLLANERHGYTCAKQMDGTFIFSSQILTLSKTDAMAENYTELKSLEDMPGSINAHISHINHYKRPYALSESFAHTPANIERARQMNVMTIIEETHSGEETQEMFCMNILMRFLFHITLISIFESVFFFKFISKMEDGGIQKTVGGIISNIAASCQNFSALEDAFATDILSMFINTSQINSQANQDLLARNAFNNVLFVRAWIYVGCLSGVFCAFTVYVKLKKIKIHWRYLLLENLGLVLMLAAYEYMFFTTIIFPYEPISGNELTQQALQEIEFSCGIFASPTIAPKIY